MVTNTYTLNSIIKNVVDNRGPRRAYYYQLEKYPVIDTVMINNEIHPALSTATRYLSESQYHSFLRGHIHAGDLLIALVGNGIGNVTLAPHSKCAIVQNAIGITFDEKMCNQLYMYYYFKSIQQEMKNLDRGVSQPSINREDLFRIRVALPSVDIQTKIGERIYWYDSLIEVNNDRIKTLEKIAANLYKEWFVRFRFPGYETTSFESGIPKGWKITRTKNVCQITTGKKDVNQTDPNGSYPFFSCDRENLLFSNDAFLDKEAVIISGNGTFAGYTKCYRGKFDIYQRTYALYDFEQVSWQYMYWSYKLGFEKEQINRSHGSAIPYITKPIIEKYKIIIPNQETLAAASQVFNRIYDLCEVLNQENRKLTIQRDLLLPRLMSGKLEICTEA